MADRILRPAVVAHRGREVVLLGADIHRTHPAVVVGVRRGILRVCREVVRRTVQVVELHTDPVGEHHTGREGHHHWVGWSSHPGCRKRSRWHPESF